MSDKISATFPNCEKSSFLQSNLPVWLTQPFDRMFRVMQYLPVIWRNEDWDYAWIYRLMAYKLERVEKCLANDKLHENAERYARQVRVCRILLERLEKDEYCEKELEEYYQRWGKAEFLNNALVKSKVVTEQDRLESAEEIRRIFTKEEERRTRDLDTFWLVFKKYHRHWWT